MRTTCRSVVVLLDATAGETLQQRWTTIEEQRWSAWEAGERRLVPARQWTWGPAALVLSRSMRPGWELLSRAQLSQWLGWLPGEHPLNEQLRWLQLRVGRVQWPGEEVRRRAHLLGVRIMLHRGYDTVGQITEADLRAVPERVSRGIDALDAVLCAEGVLGRTAQRGSQRRLRSRRLTPGELVAGSQIPERVREVHRLYLEAYQQRISDVYATTRHKHNSLEKLWAYLDANHPEVQSAAQVRRAHLLAFVPYAIERAREVQRAAPRLPVGRIARPRINGVKRTHRGAIAKRQIVSRELSGRTGVANDEKKAIAQACLELISEGDTIFLDSGTTIEQLALALVERRRTDGNAPRATVLTNSLAVTQAVARRQASSTSPSGGASAPSAAPSWDPSPSRRSSASCLRRPSSASAASADGVTVVDLDEAQLKATVIERAGQVVVAADHSKVGAIDFATVCPLSEIDVVVTDRSSPELEALCANADVRLVVAPVYRS